MGFFPPPTFRLFSLMTPMLTATGDTTHLLSSRSEDVAMVHAEPLAVGLVLYLVGWTALTAWEEHGVPFLKRQFPMLDIPYVKGQLTLRQKDVPWITPLLFSGPVPPPTLDALLEKRHFCIGHRQGMAQFITFESRDALPGVCERSEEWSDWYGADVMVFKQVER